MFEGTLYLGITTPSFFILYGYSMARNKARRTSQENYAIKQKIIELESQGIEPDRAVAAAFRMYRDGELIIDIAPNLTDEQQELRREQARRRRIVSKPASFLVDIAKLAGIMKLQKEIKKDIKK